MSRLPNVTSEDFFVIYIRAYLIFLRVGSLYVYRKPPLQPSRCIDQIQPFSPFAFPSHKHIFLFWSLTSHDDRLSTIMSHAPGSTSALAQESDAVMSISECSGRDCSVLCDFLWLLFLVGTCTLIMYL